jgi:Cu+-exporting ATPase
VADPRQKQEIVVSLKERYRKVIMVGDGLNDLYALRAADTGVLTVQQDSHPAKCLFDAADMIIKDILQLPEILREADSNF